MGFYCNGQHWIEKKNQVCQIIDLLTLKSARESQMGHEYKHFLQLAELLSRIMSSSWGFLSNKWRVIMRIQIADIQYHLMKAKWRLSLLLLLPYSWVHWNSYLQVTITWLTGKLRFLFSFPTHTRLLYLPTDEFHRSFLDFIILLI